VREELEMKKTLKWAVTVLSLTLLGASSAFAGIFDVKLGGGYICTPWMNTQALHYNNNTLTEYAIATTDYVGSYDVYGSATLTLGHFFMNISGEYSQFTYNAQAQMGFNIKNVQLSAYGKYSVTGYESIAKYVCKEEYLVAGGKAIVSADLIRNFLKINAGGFVEANIINRLSIVAEGREYAVDSKSNCFTVGLDINAVVFKYFTVGATLESWQSRNESKHLLGGFTPIQIRNVFYANADVDLGNFGLFAGINYFCDHPEICWNMVESIDRSNQAYFTVRVGAYIHLH
jgi:hypothetical protein